MSASAFTHVVLRTAEEVAAECGSWNQIVHQEYGGNPFLAMEWHKLWLKHFSGSDTEIHYVKLLGPKQNPVGFLPITVETQRFHGFRVRVAKLAGNIYSPITCPILVSAEAVPALSYFVQQVLPALDWHLFTAANLPLELCGPAELHSVIQAQGLASYLDPGTGNWTYHQRNITSDEYLRQRPPNLRNDTRRCPKRLGALGEVNVRIVGEDLTIADIDAYRRVYARSWKEPEIDREFHPALMQAAARQGWLRLGILEVNSTPIAAQLWLATRDCGFGVKFAYDEEFKAYSPGTILMWRMCQQLFDNDKVSSLDLLMGDDRYKSHWCDCRRQRMNLVCFAPGLRSHLLHRLDRSWLPRVRKLRWLDALKRRAAKALISSPE